MHSTFNVITDNDWKWLRERKFDFCRFAHTIIHRFAPEIDTGDLWQMMQKTYNPEVFSNSLYDDEENNIVPVREIMDDLYLLGLSNGPTRSFKDVALHFLGNMFEHLLNQGYNKGQPLNIIGATSGDTGSAAIAGVRGRLGINIFMLYPLNGVSKVQELQMTTVPDENVHCIAIRGTFDDGQRIVKELFNDWAFKNAYSLSAVNSINWARIVAQAVYWFWAVYKVNGLNGEPVDVSIPTGNFGNMCSAIIAKEMGLPIRKLLLVTNENDLLCRCLTTGRYEPRKVVSSVNPAMDIQVASNFERFLYILTGRDTERVTRLSRSLARDGAFDISSELCRIEKEFGILPFKACRKVTLETIHDVNNDFGILIDPHTAAAMWGAITYRLRMNSYHRRNEVPTIVAETAQWVKFPETIKEAIGIEPPLPEAITALHDLPTKSVTLDANVESVKQYIRDHATTA